jgi:hypothetical protein
MKDMCMLKYLLGCGGAIMSSVDRFIRGLWLPTQHEFLFPSL